MSNKYLTSDELLEKIFYYMEQLFAEKEFSKTILLLTEMGKTLVHSDRASFWFWDKDNKTAWTMAALDIGKITVPENTGFIGAAMLNNEILITNDPYNDCRFNQDVDNSSGYKTKSILTMPVTNADGVVIGAYQAINKIDLDGNAEDFSDDDVKRLSLATAFCGRTLESYILYDEALKDQLTGLKNRRGMHAHYEKSIVPILKEKSAGIIICDIDHFKRVNDTYGHNAGDAILKMVASTLLSATGVDDGIFRWGGEEFLFLLPGKNLDETAAFAEKCRALVESKTCTFEGTDIKVTMSFGASVLNPELSSEENVSDADAKLYYAKEHGRNQVCRELPQE